jgi:hypothetical protein
MIDLQLKNAAQPAQMRQNPLDPGKKKQPILKTGCVLV